MNKYSATVRKVEIYHFSEIEAEDLDGAEKLAKELSESPSRNAFKVDSEADRRIKPALVDCSHTQVTVRSVEGICFLIAREDVDGQVERDDFTQQSEVTDD
tara:strand:+ start:816 stop:1118 length:303 start_codon:yes stop_codon:yes gene_type:complete